MYKYKEYKNIRILLDNGKYTLDHTNSSSDIAISLNRIVEDLQDIEAVIGDHSYTFTVPATDNNNLIFNNPFSTGSKDIFNREKLQFQCSIYHNSSILFSGSLELTRAEPSAGFYDVVVYSSFTSIADGLKDINLIDLDNIPNLLNWDYENTITQHINSDYKDSDDVDFQFSFTFYNTLYHPFSILEGAARSDARAYPFGEPDDSYQNYYYLLNTQNIGGSEEYQHIYHHQIPINFYITYLIQRVIDKAVTGWTIGGSFFDDRSIKKIVMLYTGDSDVYDRAFISSSTSESGTDELNISSFLPSDMSALDFLKGVINMFNLYITVDADSKVIYFNTYNSLFTSKRGAIDITDNIDFSTVVLSRVEDYSPSLTFKGNSAKNERILGDGRVLGNYTDTERNAGFFSITNNNFYNGYDKLGGVGDTKISSPFGYPTVKRFMLRNEYDINSADQSAPDISIFIPNISEQTLDDNKNKKFYRNESHGFVFNTEETMQYKGDPTFMYYYGTSNNSYQLNTMGPYENFLYLSIPVNLTKNYVKIPFLSPWQYKVKSKNAEVEYALDNLALDDPRSIDASYIQTLYFNLGEDPSKETDFSLVFSDNEGGVGLIHDTLYTKYHQEKYKRWKESEVLEADIMLTSTLWEKLTIATPLIYNHETYNLISLTNYSPIDGTGVIKLIKTI